jgi:hypothetical protein
MTYTTLFSDTATTSLQGKRWGTARRKFRFCFLMYALLVSPIYGSSTLPVEFHKAHRIFTEQDQKPFPTTPCPGIQQAPLDTRKPGGNYHSMHFTRQLQGATSAATPLFKIFGETTKFRRGGIHIFGGGLGILGHDTSLSDTNSPLEQETSSLEHDLFQCGVRLSELQLQSVVEGPLIMMGMQRESGTPVAENGRSTDHVASPDSQLVHSANKTAVPASQSAKAPAGLAEFWGLIDCKQALRCASQDQASIESRILRGETNPPAGEMACNSMYVPPNQTLFAVEIQESEDVSGKTTSASGTLELMLTNGTKTDQPNFHAPVVPFSILQDPAIILKTALAASYQVDFLNGTMPSVRLPSNPELLSIECGCFSLVLFGKSPRKLSRL